MPTILHAEFDFSSLISDQPTNILLRTSSVTFTADGWALGKLQVLLEILKYLFGCQHALTHTQAGTQMHKHTSLHAYMFTPAHTHKYACAYALQSNSFTHKPYAHSHITLVRTYTRAYCSQIHIHSQAIRVRTRSHTTHRHAHTHTHARAYKLQTVSLTSYTCAQAHTQTYSCARTRTHFQMFHSSHMHTQSRRLFLHSATRRAPNIIIY